MVGYTRLRVQQEKRLLAEQQQNAPIEQLPSTMSIAISTLRRSNRIRNAEPDFDTSNGNSLY